MKIVFESDDRLELRDWPWVMPACLAALCALFGYGVWNGTVPGNTFPWPFVFLPPLTLVFLLYYFERLEVVFDRVDGRVRVTRTRLTRRFETEYELSTLKKVGTIGTADSEGGMHRIALHFQGQVEPVPLTFYESNAPSVHIIAKKLQLWLHRETP